MIPDLAEPIVAYKTLDVTENHLTTGSPSLLVSDSEYGFMADMAMRQLVTDPLDSSYYDFKKRMVGDRYPEWETMEPVQAKCYRAGCHVVPGRGCQSGIGNGCGIYAYKEPESRVNAEILMWGRVYEYEYGYRAEFAQLSRLIELDGFPDLVGRFPDIPRVPLDAAFRDRILTADMARTERERAALIEYRKVHKQMMDAYASYTSPYNPSPLWTPRPKAKRQPYVFGRLRKYRKGV